MDRPSFVGAAQAVAVRSLLIVLLFVGYWTAWRPARTVVLNQVAVPVLQWSAERESDVQASAGPARLTLPSGQERGLPAPAGVPFLLPALFLVAAFPRKPYWFLFWVGHCALFFLIVALWSGALMMWPGAEAVAGFMQTYGVDLYSIGVPVALWVWERRRSSRK